MNQTYNWKTPAADGSASGTEGKLNATYGMHNLSGVHQSYLAKNDGTGGINGTMQPAAYYSNHLLERKRFKGGDLVFANYAEKRDVNGIGVIVLKKYKPLKAHTVALIEGLPPKPDKAGGGSISATTRQYGRFMEFTDLFEVKVMDPVIEEYTKELADVANETIDLLAQAALLAEAQIFFPSSDPATKITSKAGLVSNAGTNADKVRPTISDLRIIQLTMKAAKIGTIGGWYVVLHSPAVGFDLQEDLRKNYFQHYGQDYMIHSEGNSTIKPLFGLRFVEAMTAKTESVTVGSSSAFIHHTIVLGAKAYTKLEIKGNGGIQVFMKDLGSAGTLDPINQRRTIGWKINALGFKVTDPDAVVDYMTIPSQSTIITSDFDYVDGDFSSTAISSDMAKSAKDNSVSALDVNTVLADEAAVKSAAQVLVDSNQLGQFTGAQVDAKETSEILTSLISAKEFKSIKTGMAQADYAAIATKLGSTITTSGATATDAEVKALLDLIKSK